MSFGTSGISGGLCYTARARKIPELKQFPHVRAKSFNRFRLGWNDPAASIHLNMKECPTCKTCYEDIVELCPTDQTRLVSNLPGPSVIDGKYKLLSCLGRGGMGSVFRATHLHLGRTVAVKTLLQDYANSDATAVSRFGREARAAAAVQHPNVVGVSDFGLTADNVRYLVMEYVEGKSLNDIIHQEAPMPPERVCRIMKQVCAGVGAAHALNLIHRDLKPANIMVTEPFGGLKLEDMGLVFGDSEPTLKSPEAATEPELTAKVLDFGLAKILNEDILGDDSADLKTGIMGTPFYMSPEQCSSKPIDIRSDIYSLGIILYQMLTKEVPFRGDSFGAIVTGHLMQPPPSIRVRNSAVSEALESVVLRAMSKNPANRQQTAAQLMAELEAAVHPPSASSPSNPVISAPLAAVLSLRTTPGSCEVYVDGDFRGKSSAGGTLEIRLEPGEYRLKFSAPGWNDHSRTVQMGDTNQSFEVSLTHKTLSGTHPVARPDFRPPTTGPLRSSQSSAPVREFETHFQPTFSAGGLMIDLTLALLCLVGILGVTVASPADPWSLKMDRSLFGFSWWTTAGCFLSTVTILTCLFLSDYVFGHRPVPFLAWIFNLARLVFLIAFVGLTIIGCLGGLTGKWEMPAFAWFTIRAFTVIPLGLLYQRVASRRRAVIV